MAPKRKAAQAAGVKAKRQRGEAVLQKYGFQWGTEGKLLDTRTGVYPVLVRYSETEAGCTKVAAFDIDWTVTATKSGRKFASGASDWKWLYPSVPDKLKSLNKDGYRIVFFTNQAGIEKLKTKPEDVMKRIDAIADKFDIPIVAFACTGTNHYRKPATTMWDSLVQKYNHGVDVDKKKSVYVGDAAGRAKEWAPGKPRDFSCSDRMFAANVGVDFKTPEEFFESEEKAAFKWGCKNPKEILKKLGTEDKTTAYHKQKQEMVIMVGPPASGKSSFCHRFLKKHGYVVVNRDTLGTAAKCLKGAKQALEEKKSVVIDNTNPSKMVRADYLDLAETAEVPCRCIHIQTPVELAHHLNFMRMTQTNGEVRRVPDVAYNMYKKNFEEPKTDEGFTEVVNVNFAPYFKDKADEELFKHWTTVGH